MIAVIIYFLCSTGFAMSMLISTLNKCTSDKDCFFIYNCDIVVYTVVLFIV